MIIRSKLASKSCSKSRFVMCLAFPNHNLFPTGRLECRAYLGIPLNVSREFFTPKFKVTLRRIGQIAFGVPVPIAAMNVNSGSILWKHNVRFTGNISAIETEAVA